MQKTILTISLDGGCHCFDFINTVHSRKENFVRDYLRGYADLINWSQRASLLPKARLKQLSAFAKQNRGKENGVLLKALKLRSILYGIFSRVAEKKKPDAELLRQFNLAVNEAFGKIKFDIGAKRVDLIWPTEIQLEEPLWQIVKSAYDILTQEDEERIKECEACGWIFLDKSKNGRRRWCSMGDCGSKSKALRYYYRNKEKC